MLNSVSETDYKLMTKALLFCFIKKFKFISSNNKSGFLFSTDQSCHHMYLQLVPLLLFSGASSVHCNPFQTDEHSYHVHLQKLVLPHVYKK